MTAPTFREVFGADLDDTINRLKGDPVLTAEARELEAHIAADKRKAELQLLKEICDGADNGVYKKEGKEIAERFVGADGTRDYYMQLGLRDALRKAGLLGRKR